ncbi:DUF6383 domain-containing protein [uncultured Parabacteroides sp.]|jgi:hypothetical protein|uniref:DUF6383 domain-containing protein n=2 Tax=uncultured Parabacteroides sp. TaxID=512312 RepID=UPI0025D8EFAB|nr:DUF6383 domain-containing protein [uncultured Parabacteroides sp.]
MNKRFSTLLAAALVAGGLSSTGMAQIANPQRFQDVAASEVASEKVEEGFYYHLGTTGGKHLSFLTDATDKKVYLQARPISSSSADAEVYVASTDSALWEPTITISNNVKSFKFTNKLTGKVLAVKYNKDKAAAEWVAEDADGAISSFAFDNSKNLICYDDARTKYVLDIKSTGKAEFVKWESGKTYGAAEVYTPAQKLLSAKELNAIGNGSFKLNVLDAVTDNSADFIKGATLIAYQAKVGSETSGVYLQVSGATKENTREAADGGQFANDGKTALKNKHVFLVVDTVFNTGTAFNDSIGGRGLKIASDSVTCLWNTPAKDAQKLYEKNQYIQTGYTLPDAAADLSFDEGANIQVAEGRHPANYRFYIYKNVAKVGAEGFTVKVDSIPSIFELKQNSTYKTPSAGKYYKDAQVDSVGYFAIARTGTGNPGLFTVVDSTTLSKAVADTYATISTAEGKLATLEKGVYSIQVKDGAYLAAALVATKESAATEPAFTTAATASALVPATQFAIDGRNGYYAVVNRENGGNAFNNGAAKVYIYTTDKADEYKVQGEDDIYIIKKLTVADDEYLGYKHFTDDELANYTAKLKFNTAFGGDNLYVVATSTGKLTVADADAADAMEFSLRAAATDTVASGSKAGEKTYAAVEYGNKDLKRSAYHLYAVNDDSKVLTYNTTSKTFEIRTLDNSASKKYDDKVGYAKVDSISTPVLFRMNADEQYQLILADTAYHNPEGSKGDPSHLAYYKVDSLRMGQINVAGSGASLILTPFDAAPMGYFTLELPDDAAFVDPIKATPSHNRIASARNTTLAISMNDKKQGVLKAETELKADAFVESDFAMFIDTANMDNQKGEKPLFYILTTRGLDAEAVADGQAMYMSSKDGSSVEFIKAKQFGEAGRDSLLVYATKANEKDAKLKLADNYATFAFASTSTKGEYKIQNVKNKKYLAQTNGILNLAGISPYSGLAFTVNAAEAPTSNEAIATSEVAVIAGEGQVTIAGAQGKKVVISNILGQVVANTVLTSDNAVIAAPAGVVVVAVEGEEAVKAIVK